MSEVRMTAEQRAVAEASPQNILVSAAAGSGKTFVMTERLIGRLIQTPLSLDRCLVLTFTNAASESMERKIRERLDQAIAQAREAGQADISAKLETQTLALQRAHISTIHAFCLWLIQNFPHQVVDENGQPLVEADFRTLDEKAADELRERALAEVLAEAYEKAENDAAGSDCFFALLDHYAGTKSDQELRELILATHDYLRSLPDYKAYTEQMLQKLAVYSADFASSPHMKYLLRELRLRLQLALAATPALRAELQANSFNFVKKAERDAEYRAMFSEWFDAAETADRLLQAYEQNGGAFAAWDELYELTCQLTWEKPRILKNDPPEKAAFVDGFMAAYADFMGCFGKSKGVLADQAVFPELPIVLEPLSEIEAALRRTEAVIGLLFKLLLQMDERYQALKLARRGIDFSDYEHFALRILSREDGLAFCREQFEEVFIDEYQDTSSIQEAILSLICPAKLFMVGDVKQSIYRFRHARPETFLQKAAAFARGEGGRYMSLNKNFRSQAGILQAVNELFSRLMTADFSGIDYAGEKNARRGRAAAEAETDTAAETEAETETGTEGHAMIPGRRTAVLPERCEIWLQKTDADKKTLRQVLTEEAGERLFAGLAGRFGGYNAYQFLEAEAGSRLYFLTALEIIRLHEEEQVPWSDIAVMARGNASCDRAAAVFTALGIPQNRQRPAAVNESYPLQLQLALMQTLDNVRRDIPLATVLLSELSPVPFTESELVLLRIRQREEAGKGSLFDALRQQAEGEDLLADKARHFLTWLEARRRREPHLSAKALLHEIWHETDYPAKLRRDEGEEGVAALESFTEQLSALEREGRYGLHEVLSYFEDELSQGKADNSENDFNGRGVNILTFHKSKGLEYPYVFLLNLSAKLEDKDQRRRLIISEDLGIGFDNIGTSEHYTYPSLLRLAMEGEKRQRYLTEEICLLYVAMSRAEEKLYLCCDQAYKEGEAHNEQLLFLRDEASKMTGPALPSYVLQAVNSYQDMLFLGLSLLPYPPLRQLFEALGMPLSKQYREQQISRQQVALSVRAKEKGGLAEPAEDLAWAVRLIDDLPAYEASLRQMLSRPRTAAATSGFTREEAAEAGLRAVGGSLRDFYAFHKDFPALPKQTVSEIKRRSQETENLDEETTGEINLNIHSLADVQKQLKEKKLTAAEQGIALHNALRFLSLTAFAGLSDTAADEAETARQLGILTEHNFLDARERQAVEAFIPQLAAYALSPLAEAIRRAEHEGRAFRELPFTFRYRGSAEESLVQGMIDLWFSENDKIFLIDFKSDRLPEDEASARRLLSERYLIQLRLYALALEAGTGKKLAEAAVWSVRLGQSFRFSRRELGLD